MKFSEALEFKKLVTFIPNKKESIHNWYYFKEGFRSYFRTILSLWSKPFRSRHRSGSQPGQNDCAGPRWRYYGCEQSRNREHLYCFLTPSRQKRESELNGAIKTYISLDINYLTSNFWTLPICNLPVIFWLTLWSMINLVQFGSMMEHKYLACQ